MFHYFPPVLQPKKQNMTLPVERIVKFFDDAKRPILFSGAGVSAKAGIPVWGKLLTNLAEWLRSKDPLIANKIVELIAKYDFLRAAEFFFLSDAVTDKERFGQLLQELLPTHPEKIDILCSLPFVAAVTTNFDRTLLDSFAAVRGKAPIDFKRGDSSFRQALHSDELYVCRVHGFVEDPESIVLTSRHFDEIDKDPYYRDYVASIFTRANLLLVGLSFSDPAILAVLQAVNNAYGPLAVGEHLAVVPTDVSSDVLSRLNRLNIEVVYYDHPPGDFSHSELWNVIGAVEKELKDRAKTTVKISEIPTEIRPFDTAKKYLASCYARSTLGSQIGPLREAIVEGMVSAIVQSASPNSVSTADLVKRIHLDTSLSMENSEELVKTSLTTLSDEKLCIWHKRSAEKKVNWIGATDDKNQLEAAISKLVSNTVDRAFVEEGYRSTTDSKKSLSAFFTQLVLQRGWDLGAAFASGKIPKGADFKVLMFQVARTLHTSDVELLSRVCERMIHNPTGEEAAILAALGRASFGLELALQAPRSQMLHSSTLPSRIYLDANVVMPAFIVGHTYHSIYAHTIDSLKTASTGNGPLQICTTYGYLNEIVSHRKLAVAQFEDNPEHFQSDVIKEAIFSGSTNMNVFVGAYANMASSNSSLSFPTFMAEFAPFVTEMELARWLSDRGVHLIKKEQVAGTLSMSDISLELQKGYASSLKSNKDVRLLEHDSVQLASLFRDVENGVRAVLVTADRRLREVVGASKLKNLASHMVSHVGLTQLVDLLIGANSDNRSLAHLLWDSTISERSNELRRYFIGLALRHYDEAMAMELPGLVEKFTDQVMTEARRKGIHVDNRVNSEQRDWFNIAGSFEDRFFAAISEKIQLRQKQAEADNAG
ncbi:hypothetical protein F2P45_26535 [Massilia sp. CCM 8733]|uniref:SIR2-like domain-containing protein n=1 Tax=Massilia mucilaginosa TaxID=2609282 RepID=A0ABX0P0A0_9BURK|nr:SIR2 family protein [Massilia mucilaginosa]NHZ92537.1 hypothetical protein [Massilia mucilaginosa]